MILIEENGQRSLVQSIDGHDSATVLAEDVPDPPAWATVDDLGDDGLPLVAVLQARLWERVKAIRDEREEGIAQTPMGPVQTDEKSKTKVLGLLKASELLPSLGMPFTESYTDANNIEIPLDVENVKMLAVYVFGHVSQVFAHAKQLRAAIEAARAALAQTRKDEG